MEYRQYYLPRLNAEIISKIEAQEFKEYISAGTLEEQVKRLENMGLMYLDSWEDESCDVPERISLHGEVREYSVIEKQFRDHPYNLTRIAIEHLATKCIEDMWNGEGIFSWNSFLDVEDEIISKYQYRKNPTAIRFLPGLSRKQQSKLIQLTELTEIKSLTKQQQAKRLRNLGYCFFQSGTITPEEDLPFYLGKLKQFDKTTPVYIPERIICPSGNIYNSQDLFSDSKDPFDIEIEMAKYLMQILLDEEIKKEGFDSISFDNEEDMLTCVLKYGTKIKSQPTPQNQ